MPDLLHTKIASIGGIGDRKALLLEKEVGIKTIEDLIYYFPYRYVDKSKYVKINQIESEEVYIQIKGRVISKEIITGKANRLSVRFADETGSTELVFFKGLKWMIEALKEGEYYVIFGKPSKFQNSFNFVHPEFELLNKHLAAPPEHFSPMYSTTEAMKNAFLNSKTLSKIIRSAFALIGHGIEETLPEYIIKKYSLSSRANALFQIHFPDSTENLEKAKMRLKFEELFFMQLEHQITKSNRHEKSKGFVFGQVGEHFHDFYNNHLPFSLTKAQQRVIKEIRADMRSGHQMNRLLQGDVGSGKTLVALLTILIALDNGFQGAIMTPTEILANQHYNSIKAFLKDMPLRVALLTGSTKAAERRKILPKIENGEIDIVIGTHALLEESVVFKNLGLAVIDEQHRFGVQQRYKMWRKNTIAPHILVMTATPIPRTLAMTVYGDLECSVIDELPPGRKPVTTVHFYEKSRRRLFDFIREQIRAGRQIYIVYPLIEESEKLDLLDLKNGYDAIERSFPLPDYHISMLHGRLKPQDKEYEMDLFKRGITNIMVATTVIEVGVDIPNASVMVIENAERFGLSQLHQLRGRVGRGAEQSFCILMTKDNLSADSRKRIETMCQTSDGFAISEADLQLRGPGDIAGTAQSGILNLRIADIVKDEPIMREARRLAEFIISRDPQLLYPDNALLRKYIINKQPEKDYSMIS
ncbi:MAG: ATP-dependent DNA helicase RecG [Bacteroidales bacterium]|jgi:ATP-dependent DNA helicase RecG|nr:ATP-dependent DNA helicase RecG [Bacteroidales bacterium]